MPRFGDAAIKNLEEERITSQTADATCRMSLVFQKMLKSLVTSCFRRFLFHGTAYSAHPRHSRKLKPARKTQIFSSLEQTTNLLQFILAAMIFSSNGTLWPLVIWPGVLNCLLQLACSKATYQSSTSKLSLT